MLYKNFESCMKKEFEISMMGELIYFLELQIKQRSDGIFINQAKYTRELIMKFGLEDVKISKTPMAITTKLDKDEQGKNVDIKLYRSIIGSLLYLTASRPDIMFSVCLCTRFQSCPKESHLIAIKYVFRYLKGTMALLKIWNRLVVYENGRIFNDELLDADYAGCRVDRKSTSGICQFLENCLVSWSSKKQKFRSPLNR